MVICFSCSRRIKDDLDHLIRMGHYLDYSEIIATAIANLLTLHDDMSGRRSVVIGESAQPQSGLDLQVDSRERRGGPSKSTVTKQTRTVESSARVANIPTLFLLDNLKAPPALAPLPVDKWSRGAQVPLDRWLFCQYNKLLPAKASCRALAHLLSEKANGVSLEDAATKIAHEACLLGDYLAQLDVRHHFGRDEALAVAFPSTKKDSDKSSQRYARQFVANVDKQGNISGLLIGLKLINFVGSAHSLMLTEAGWRFAQMENPVLDGLTFAAGEKFTAEERSFLLRHVARNVPAEDFAYRAILAAIADGVNRPEALDATLREHIPREKEAALTPSFLSAQRSGAISRMVDLLLVARIREGVTVTYAVTDEGRGYLSNDSGE